MFSFVISVLMETKTMEFNNKIEKKRNDFLLLCGSSGTFLWNNNQNSIIFIFSWKNQNIWNENRLYASEGFI